MAGGLPIIITIEGEINANGSIKSGSGFTVSHEYTGVYIVEFDHAFFGPNIQITLTAKGLGEGLKTKLIEYNTAAFKYFTLKMEENSMDLRDIAVHFTAEGMKI